MTAGVTYVSIDACTEWSVDIKIEPGSVPDYRNRFGGGLHPTGLRIRVLRYLDARLPSFPGAAADEAEPDLIEVTLTGPRLKKDGTPGKRPGQDWFPFLPGDPPPDELRDALLDELPDWAAKITRTVLRDIGPEPS